MFLRFCHGCVLREQQRVAGNNNGRVPKWLKCMTCRENTSFRPDEPKYHRLLIDLLGRAQQYASAQIKLEQECKIISPVSSETDEAEERESPKAKVEGPCTDLGLFSSDFPKHDNRLEQDSNLDADVSSDPQNNVKLRENTSGGNSRNECTEETQHATFQLGDFQLVDPENPAKVGVVLDPMMKELPKVNRNDSTDEEMNASSQNNREQLLIQLMQNLQSHVSFFNAEHAGETIDEMSGYTDLMTPSFITQYPLGETIRSARKAFGNSYPEIKMKCKTLSSEMRRIYERETENGAQATNRKRTNEQVEDNEQKASEEPDATKGPCWSKMSISKKPRFLFRHIS